MIFSTSTGMLLDIIKRMLETPTHCVWFEGGRGDIKAAEVAEIHLFEALGLITSSQYVATTLGGGGVVDDSVVVAAARQQQSLYQQQMLQELARLIVQQLQSLLLNPQLTQYADQISPTIAHRINCLSSLSKGHRFRNKVKSSWENCNGVSIPAADGTIDHLAAQQHGRRSS
jgi:hypothetical protein